MDAVRKPSYLPDEQPHALLEAVNCGEKLFRKMSSAERNQYFNSIGVLLDFYAHDAKPVASEAFNGSR